jgi:predicted lipoprotein with Yx(FWY)xxD motif
VVIHTGTVLIAEAPRNVLTDAQGFTLYYHTADTSSVVCSGSCASTWPPLTDASGTPTASPPLPGQLGVRDDENGRQVTYNGHPLYRYSGDKGPGQANGQGVGKLWYVAPPALQAAR